MAEMTNPSDTGGRLIAAGKVNGTTVYNTAGEKLGSVYDVMLDKISGRTEYAILPPLPALGYSSFARRANDSAPPWLEVR